MIQALSSGIFDSQGRPLADDASVVAASIEGELWRPVLIQIRSHLFAALVAISIALVAGIILASVKQVVAAAIVVVLGIAVAGFLHTKAGQLQPTERVKSISKVNWVGLALPLEGGTALYDLSGVFPNRSLSLQEIERPEALAAVSARLDALAGELNVFEPHDEKVQVPNGPTLFGRDGALARILSDLRQILVAARRQQIDIPAIPTNSPLVTALKRLRGSWATQELGVAVLADIKSPLAETNRRIEGLYRLAHAESNFDLDDLLAQIETQLGFLAAHQSEAFDQSLALVRDIHSRALAVADWNSNAYHCPWCAKERRDSKVKVPGQETETTRLICDLEKQELVCEVCRQPAPPGTPIETSRLVHEIFVPLHDQIVLSLRSEILGIDRAIHSELSHLDTQRQVDLQKERMEVDRGQRLQASKIREFSSRAGALEAKITGTTLSLANYNRIAHDIRRRFDEDASRLRAEAVAKSERAAREIDAWFAQREAQAKAEVDWIDNINRVEDSRKEAALHAKLDALADATMLTEGEKTAIALEYGPMGPFSQLTRPQRRKGLLSW